MIRIIKSGEFYKAHGNVQQVVSPASVTATVTAIIEDVINRGDEALREYTEKYDGCLLESFELSKEAIDEAFSCVEPDFIGVMERAARNIEDFHRNQVQKGFDLPPENGVILGQRVTPIERVGLYVPGGTAPYPSSVLMNCIPAKIAGVREVIITTPPSGDESHSMFNGVTPRIIAAAKIAGVDRIFTMGGAQAVAALAYGTKTVPRVDKITGPGNAYVAEAKRQVFGIVGIDMIAGPSDVLIIADETADPIHVAADILSQSEHGSDSPAVLVTNSTALSDKVAMEIEVQLSKLPRADMARKAVDELGLIVVTKSLEEAFEISNIIAPEHLEILLDEPFNYLDKVKNAGAVFLGKHTTVALGDYYAGPNHTLPTSGTARFSSPLSVDDFIKKTSYAYYSKEALHAASGDVIRFAKEEGLDGHALSVSKRL